MPVALEKDAHVPVTIFCPVRPSVSYLSAILPMQPVIVLPPPPPFSLWVKGERKTKTDLAAAAAVRTCTIYRLAIIPISNRVVRAFSRRPASAARPTASLGPGSQPDNLDHLKCNAVAGAARRSSTTTAGSATVAAAAVAAEEASYERTAGGLPLSSRPSVFSFRELEEKSEISFFVIFPRFACSSLARSLGLSFNGLQCSKSLPPPVYDQIAFASLRRAP